MKKILTAAIALSVLASAGAASAQSYGGYQNRDGSYQSQGGYDHDRRDERRDDRRDDRRDERRDDRRDTRGYDHRDDRYDSRYERRADRRYNAGRYHQPYGYQQRQWRRGDRLPSQYRGRAYAVDYRYYRLPPPPRGYQYSRVDNDVVLTAIASGVIASVLIGMFQ